ncbi:MAG: hypothetical protein LBJ60_03505 [Tannerellaceae bacterium]|jgi:hypothetical protein|nr:hypothetical protein [Tannerellaceae bacterium]
MITEEMIRKEFISQTVTEGIKKIYDTQENVVRENLTGGTGRLADYLFKAPFYNLKGKTYFVRLFSYLRFMDIRYRRQNMHLRRKLALYNRVVWGVLYHETLPDLHYGLTEDIRRQVHDQLMSAKPEK